MQKRIHQSTHPLIKSLVNHLRDSEIDALRFRHLVMEITRLMAYESLSDAPLRTQTIHTWQGPYEARLIDEEKLLFATILRAGMPMLEGLNQLFAHVPSGFLAMKRDEETKKSVLYYDRVPSCEGRTVLLADVMVATGGSLSDAIDLIKTKNPKRIVTLNIIGAPEGLAYITRKHPDIDIFIAQIDEKLNADKFILPGLGDAGDRSYNTTKSEE
jgi:uracil phosphoribosyltransferase